jgi:hypothetical protein
MGCEWRTPAMMDHLIIRTYNFNHDPKRNTIPKLSSFCLDRHSLFRRSPTTMVLTSVSFLTLWLRRK